MWVYGLNPVIEVLRHRPKRVAEIRIHRGKGTPAEIFETAKKFNIPIKETSRADLENICGSEAHQGIIAKAPLPEYAQLGNLLERIKDKNSKGYGGPEGSRAHALILILDSISDPQNLGSLIRVAECAGVDAVIIPRDRAAGLSPAVAKASAGAIEWVPVCRVVNLKRAIAELKEAGFWVIGTSGQNGDLLWQADLTGRLAVVIGSEGKGMRPGVAAACDRIMRVPLQGRINSLNASVSAGVILFEILRQNQERLKPGI